MSSNFSIFSLDWSSLKSIFFRLYNFLEGMKIDLVVLAIKRRLRILILKNNEEKGAAMNAKINEIIDVIPPTSPKTSNSPQVYL